MKKEIGVIFIAVSFLPSLLVADVKSQSNMAPQANQYDNRYMHPAYQRHQAYQQNFYNQRPVMQRPTPPAYMQQMREQHDQRMAEQRERMQQQRPSSERMQQMREQHEQRMAEQRERMKQQRPSSANMQQMRKQHEQRMNEQRERMQQQRPSSERMQQMREQHEQRMVEQRDRMKQQRPSSANTQQMREQHEQRMNEQRERMKQQRPSPVSMQQMRKQREQRMVEQRERMKQQRPSPANMQQMREQHEQRVIKMRERMQQMHAKQRPSARECGRQNLARNNFMRPGAYRGYPRPQASSVNSNRMNSPQRPVYQRTAYSSYRGYQARPQWNQYRAQANPQAPRQYYSRNHYRQSPPVMPSSAYMVAPDRRQYAQARSYYPKQNQINRNWNGFRNNQHQNRIPPVAYQPETTSPELKQKALSTMPVSGPYQAMRINKAAYVR